MSFLVANKESRQKKSVKWENEFVADVMQIGAMRDASGMKSKKQTESNGSWNSHNERIFSIHHFCHVPHSFRSLKST